MNDADIVLDAVRRVKAGELKRPTNCVHLEQITAIEPSAVGCEDCLKSGSKWVHLRVCLTCGYVGCCNSSPNKHASRHAKVQLHLNKGLAGAPDWVRDEVRTTMAVNPVAADAFTLVIVAAGQHHKHPGLAGHEPDIAAGMHVVDSDGRRVGDVEAVEIDEVTGRITRIRLDVDGQALLVDLQGRPDGVQQGTRLAVRIPAKAVHRFEGAAT